MTENRSLFTVLNSGFQVKVLNEEHKKGKSEPIALPFFFIDSLHEIDPPKINSIAEPNCIRYTP